ncbi:MAG: DUF3106 domain-containing protein [Polaromonas sp.]
MALLLVAASFLLAIPRLSFGQTPKPVVAASAPAAKPLAAASKPAAVKPAISRPVWSELTPMQQKSLAPLAQSWNSISDAQKRKWLEISKNYPSLPPETQATMHSRMNEWVNLKPEQRAQARLNFARTKELSRQLTPDEKKARWETYQALSPEEKQKLAAKAVPKPVGAATALKPVAPQKLAAVPPHAVPKLPASAPAAPVAAVVPQAAAPATGAAPPVPQR